MKQKWLDLVALFDRQSQREKLFIVACVLAGLYGLWTLVFASKLLARQDELTLRFNNVISASEKTNTLQKIFIDRSQNNPNKDKQNKIAQLEKKLTELDKSLETLSVGLVPAAELSNVVRDVLVSNKHMQLIGLTARPAEELQLQVGQVHVIRDEPIEAHAETTELISIVDMSNKTQQPSQKPTNQGIGVYKHAVVLQLKGSYFNTIQYLQALEHLDWTFYWSALDFVVENNGGAHDRDALITLEVYTLSTEKGASIE